MPVDDVPVGAAVEVDDGAGAVAVLLGATGIDDDRTVVVGDAGGGFVDPHAVSTAAAVAARPTPPVSTRFQLVIPKPPAVSTTTCATLPSHASSQRSGGAAALDDLVI